MPTMTTMQIIWHNNYQSLTFAIVNHILYKYSSIVGLTTQLMMPLITSTTARSSLNLNLGIFHTTKIIRLTGHFNLSTDDNISCNQGCIQQQAIHVSNIGSLILSEVISHCTYITILGRLCKVRVHKTKTLLRTRWVTNSLYYIFPSCHVKQIGDKFSLLSFCFQPPVSFHNNAYEMTPDLSSWQGLRCI